MSNPDNPQRHEPTGAGAGPSGGTRHSWFTWERFKDVIAVLTPIVTIILGVIQWQLSHEQERLQSALDQRVGRTKIIDDMVANINQHVKDSTLKDQAKARITISLMKIRTDASIDDDGKLDSKQEESIHKLPLYFALLSNNDDMLADIGAEKRELALWVPFAQRTGDQGIKSAALNALDQIMATTASIGIRKEVARSILGMNIPSDNPELRQRLRDSIVKALARSQLAEEPTDKEMIDLNGRLNAALDDLVVKQAISASDQEPSGQITTAPAFDTTSAGVLPIKNELQQAAANAVANLPEPNPDEVGALISQLDGEQRRLARSELARIGAPAVPALIAALTAPNPTYRIQLGAVTALALMAPADVKLPQDGAEAVVKLLGHSDDTMRKTAALLLNSLVDPESLKRTGELLFSQLKESNNGNLVYNSVTVLGSWLPRGDLDPAFRADIRTGLEEAQDRFRSAPGWQKTLSILDGYLRR
ncbi:hypothetical protein JL100_032845 (plasmid) [Skermanella mucosa]|uniref:HEAT repeat domain-containing protein n=1 Tax=Skermanella mucosa TaxID=1789672 RepID=UPI00192CB72D|nr:hypothetical protein [Skermanella mucosa]UEM24410.1 hypothetical protein JL100_032845 [Skermanella mucosa]